MAARARRGLAAGRARVNFAVVLLCAGGSSRMGRAKGLLAYRGRTLVEHVARVALASGATETIVVLGDQAVALRERLRELPVRIVVNKAWRDGMGGSIRAGIAALSPGMDRAVIALGDQPRITPAHLSALAKRLEGVPIVASSYDGILGAPCAFAREEFPRLLELCGDVGARALVRSGEEEVAMIAFEGAHVDVDTPEAYRSLLAEEAVLDSNGATGAP